MGRGWRGFHHANSFGPVLSLPPSLDLQPQHMQHLPHPTIPNKYCVNRHQAPPHLNLFPTVLICWFIQSCVDLYLKRPVFYTFFEPQFTCTFSPCVPYSRVPPDAFSSYILLLFSWDTPSEPSLSQNEGPKEKTASFLPFLPLFFVFSHATSF